MMTDPSDFFVAGGSLRPQALSYVTRPADWELLERVQAGEFCYVLTPRQMGKSSLMIRTARSLTQAGVRTAMIDLTGIGVAGVTAETWYQGLLTRLAIELHLDVDVQSWWAERRVTTLADRFSEFLRDVLLAQVSQPVVIFIDEIDTTLRFDFRDDFFAAIRAIYNDRARDPFYQRLTFVLLGVATPTDLISDQTRTPFNIGQRIDLREFSREDARVLANGLDQAYPEQGETILDRIFYWTNGHPYLTQKLCRRVVNTPASGSTAGVDQLVTADFLAKKAGGDDNLKFIQASMAAWPRPERRQALKLYQKVWAGQPVPSEESSPVQNHLALAGLVRPHSSRLQVRNEIYRRVFDQAWVKENMPVDTQLRWAIYASLVAVLLVVGLITFIVLYRQDPPDIQAQVCKDSFLESTSPAVRIDALACLFDLGAGYDEQARLLFYSLSPTDQQYLFLLDNPQSVGPQLVSAIGGIYVSLDWLDEGHDRAIMEAMIGALGASGQPAASNLGKEIELWRHGRELADQGQYDEAITYYVLAIEANSRDGHPVIHHDLATAYLNLQNYNQALANLEAILEIAQKAPPTPTPTPLALSSTPTPTVTFTLTPTFSPTSKPTLEPVPGVAATQPVPSSPSTPTPGLPVSTPSTPEPTPTRMLELRFIGPARWRETVRETIFESDHPLQNYFLAHSADYTELTRMMGPEVAATARAAGSTVVTVPTRPISFTVVAFNPDGSKLLTVNPDRTASLREAASGVVLRDFSSPSYQSAAFSPDGNYMAFLVDRSRVELWDMEGRLVRSEAVQSEEPGWSIAFSPAGNFIAVAGEKGVGLIPYGNTGPPFTQLTQNTTPTWSVAFSPDGIRLVGGGSDGKIRLWDTRTGELLSTLTGHTGPVWSVAFSPDGRTLASGGEDGKVRLWDVQSNQPLEYVLGHFGPVHSVAFSPDGKLLASSGGDQTVNLWDMSISTDAVQALRGHNAPVYSVAFSPDGETLASRSGDGIVTLWNITTRRPIVPLSDATTTPAPTVTPTIATATPDVWILVADSSQEFRAPSSVEGGWRYLWAESRNTFWWLPMVEGSNDCMGSGYPNFDLDICQETIRNNSSGELAVQWRPLKDGSFRVEWDSPDLRFYQRDQLKSSQGPGGQFPYSVVLEEVVREWDSFFWVTTVDTTYHIQIYRLEE